jgi:uncharacterized protein (TIGR00269 family)
MQKEIKCRSCRENPVITIYENKRKLCRKHFLEYFEKKVRRTVRLNEFFEKGEHILIAFSGGKDSTTALFLMNKIAKERKAKVSAITIDTSIGDYAKKNLINARKFCRQEKIKLYEVSIKKEFGKTLAEIVSLLKSNGYEQGYCTVCGILRRNILNRKAKELKAAKVVTGHNLDDEAQSILMNIFKNHVNVMARLGPKSAELKGFVPRIKPLYFMTEQEVAAFSKQMNFPVLYDKCPHVVDAFRKEVRNTLNDFDGKYTGTKHSIIASFLEILPLLRKKYSGKLSVCRSCGEPAANELCKCCELIGRIK